MRIPWPELSKDEYVRLCYEIAPLIGFQRRTYIESGPTSPGGYDIIGHRDNEILPGVGYPEKWLLVAMPYSSQPLRIEDIEFVKKWADEPFHEIDYILLITPAKISQELEDWFLKFNRFPIKKYKFKFLSRVELDQIVANHERILNSFFSGFKPRSLNEDEEAELLDVIVRRILNFRSDLGIVDIYLNILFTLPEDIQQTIIDKIAGVWSFEGFERLKRWNAGWVLIRLAKLKPKLLPFKTVEKVVFGSESIYKAQAAHIYAWLSTTYPDAVEPQILSKLLDSENDYFIQVPVSKAIVNLMEYSEESLTHVFELIKSEEALKRYSGAKIIAAIAEENPMLVPPSVIKSLSNDENAKIRKIGVEISEKVLSFWEAPFRAQFNEALNYFEKKDYEKALEIFSRLSKKQEFSLAEEAVWWAGYCNYLQRNYQAAISYFKKLAENKDKKASAYWWMAACYEKIGKKDLAIESIQKTAASLNEDNLSIKISPDKEINSEEARPLLFKRLKELSN